MKKAVVYPSLTTLPGEYWELFDAASQSCGFFLSLDWFRNLETNVLRQTNTHLRIYGVETAAGNACLALPMCYTKPIRFFMPRQLAAVANYYTSLFSPVLDRRESNHADELVLVAQAIACEVPKWDVVTLAPLAQDNAILGDTMLAFQKAGMAVQSYFCFGNWYLQVNGRSYQEYFDSLPSKLKNTIKRKSKQLEDTGDVRLKILCHQNEVQEGITAFEHVYRASWKVPEPYPAFIPGLITLCAQQGWLRLGVAYINGKPAAAQLWIVHNRIASIYKLAYDEQFAKLSIGSILTAHLMQHVIDIDCVDEVDYLTGDEPYKQDWMSHRRERWGIIAFNLRTWRGLLAAFKHIGGRMLKKSLMRMTRQTPPISSTAL